MRIETNPDRVAALARQREDDNWAFRSYLKGSDIPSSRLDRLVHELAVEVCAQIDCRACANCCKTMAPSLTAADIERLAAHLGLTAAAFTLQFLREDEKAFVQVGPDLLAVNHLALYPTWEGFLPLVQDALVAYAAIAQPRGLRRIGLRYVNRIAIPTNPVDLADYLNFRPFIGPGLPQRMSGFILGVQVPYDDGRDILRLQLTTDEPGALDSVVVLLDMDYFMAQPEAVLLPKALEWIEIAHARVQEAFEACINNRLRTLFNV